MTAEEEVQERFIKNELVLCYEPDKEKKRVLYEAKILADCSSRDKTDRQPEYIVHFLGWGRKWDQKVKADTLLKDNEENRKLMNELAATAKLQIASTVTTCKRKDEEKSHIQWTDSIVESESLSAGKNVQMGSRKKRDSGASSSSGHSDRPSGSRPRPERSRAPGNVKFNDHQHHFERNRHIKLSPSLRLRRYLEYDNDMIVKRGKQHAVPVDVNIVEILEDFLKLRAVELAIQSAVETNSSSRQRGTAQHTEKLKSENMKVMSTVNLLKEFVDGVRIYFVFLLEDCLIYEKEATYIKQFTTPQYLSTIQRKPPASASTSTFSSLQERRANNNAAYKAQLHSYLTFIEKTARSQASPYGAADVMSPFLHRTLEDVFHWQMLPGPVPPEVSMIFGATHLARLLVKLPDHLSASPMSDEKLKKLIEHMDSLINYVEAHEEWFTESNYIDVRRQRPPTAAPQHPPPAEPQPLPAAEPQQPPVSEDQQPSAEENPQGEESEVLTGAEKNPDSQQ